MTYDRSNYRDKNRIEDTAACLRASVDLDQIDVLDPRALLPLVDATVFLASEIVEDGDVLRRVHRMGFDGCAGTFPETDEPVILLNCAKPQRRRTATLMEEIAHLLLDHRPSRIAVDPALGIMRRTFDQAQEHEAYDLGSALLLPKQRIQRDVKELELDAGTIADAHGCSQQLVSMRIRRHRLWQRYLKYAQQAA